MADEAFVQILAQRVVEKLLARQKQALVVYTGSNIGEAAALEAMGRLRGEGFTFRVLLAGRPACWTWNGSAPFWSRRSCGWRLRRRPGGADRPVQTPFWFRP